MKYSTKERLIQLERSAAFFRAPKGGGFLPLFFVTRAPDSRRAKAVPISLVAIVLLTGLLACYLYQTGWLQRAFASPRGPAVGTNGIVQVFFTTPTLVYPDQVWQRPASPLLQAVLADIDRARASVDVATFDFDIDALTNSLLRAKQRGVAVRLIVDSENLLTPEVAEQTGRLQRSDIDVQFDRREPFMHNKRIIGSLWSDLCLPNAVGHFPLVGM
jgi:phosphatidylserine/phosphatidylglycerophosphate/cardiolipin synthase-like enzyme